MCLAVPAKVLEINDKEATVDYGGVKRTTRIDMVDAKVGEYVLIHAGFAIEVMDAETALQTIESINQLMDEESKAKAKELLD